MRATGTFQEEGAACSFTLIVLMLFLFPPEGANHSMNAVYVLSHRKHVCGWRRHKAEKKAEKTAHALHILSATRNGGNVLQKPISRHGRKRRHCAVDKFDRGASKGR